MTGNQFSHNAIPNVRQKAQDLKVTVPEGIWILPENFFDVQSTSDVLYATDYELIVKLFRANNIPHSLINTSTGQYNKIVNHHFEPFVIPIIVYTIDLLQQNPSIISTSLNVLWGFLKKQHGAPDTSGPFPEIRVIKETSSGAFTRYEYRGPLDGFPDFIKFVRGDDDG